ncbi:MAG: hypothetical protein ABF547_06370, partial [Lentilactobacillus hilgardii]|uniref:hypothetical protein n=1 Tax=Lentilactobacillus hilgardii TaxID=1588 RepID=UPI0039E7BBC6
LNPSKTVFGFKSLIIFISTSTFAHLLILIVMVMAIFGNIFKISGRDWMIIGHSILQNKIKDRVEKSQDECDSSWLRFSL